MPNAKSLTSDFAFDNEISVEYLPLVIVDFSVPHQILASGTKGVDISQYSECSSPSQLLKVGVFFFKYHQLLNTNTIVLHKIDSK